jgi:hypothetical protein
MPEAKVHVRYVGNGKQFFIGAPARDLTEDEFNGLDALARRDIAASPLYEFATKKAGKEAASNAGVTPDASQESENN